MSARLSFLRRAAQEAALHGGEIYFDLNGKNIGKLQSVDTFVDVPAGTYNIRMYKSHNYGTMIGFADLAVTVKDGDDLMIRYAMPENINLPGHIMISDYSREMADQIIADTNRQISGKVAEDTARAEKSSRTTKTWIKWIIIAAVVGTVSWAIVYALIWSSIF